MQHAKAHLEVAAQVAEHNAPISEAAGDFEQAALQRETAQQCREAIEQLQPTQ